MPSRILLGVLVLLAVSPFPARAQDAPPHHAPTGKGDIDRAMTLCDAHRADPQAVPDAGGAAAAAWVPGWEACRGVETRWNEAWRAKEESDREFVSHVAGSGA
ncbi:MAG: hypothetical protein INR65_10375 [Gluconacetobacter diazotrophicus]|nr:hypothetical protein [Gluconacetobacter diazotrophicus]